MSVGNCRPAGLGAFTGLGRSARGVLASVGQGEDVSRSLCGGWAVCGAAPGVHGAPDGLNRDPCACRFREGLCGPVVAWPGVSAELGIGFSGADPRLAVRPPGVQVNMLDPRPCCGPGLRAAVHLCETPDHALRHEVPPWPPCACRTACAQGGCTQPCGGDVPSLPCAHGPICTWRGRQGLLQNRMFPGAATSVW